MSKSKYLLHLFFILLYMLGTNVYAINNDSLVQALQNMPKKQKDSALPKLSITLLLQHDTGKALKLADDFLHLPAVRVTNRQKAEFFKKLAKLFEANNDFKHALFYYKLADSLENAPNQIIKTKVARPSETQHPVWPFYLFLFISLVGLSSLIYIWFWRRQVLKNIKKLEKENRSLEVEAGQLQTNLDKEIKAETGDLQTRLEQLKQQELKLKTALKKAEEASYLRNTFIANLGFDVRTPLNGIIGFADMLETELAVLENHELYEYASNIRQSSNRLLKLMNNIIDFSSLEANTMELKIKAVSLEKILQKIYLQFFETASQKNLIFKNKIDEDLHPALADAEGLEKAVVQVVDNAIRYTGQGFVTISTLYDADKDIDIIEIKDTGPGIDKAKQKLLFEAEDTGNLKYSQGTGIGLKLAKKLIDLMQGRLELNSTPGKGTTIKLIIPCSDQAVVAAEQSPEAEVVAEKEVSTATELGELDIFVVEDDRMNRLILEKMLTKFGKVKLAVDGDDCMNIINQEAEKGHFFQIMLFDINLPGDWDGVKLLKEIRKKHPEYQHIPFIAQTAYAMAGDKDHFLKEGFDSYLSKPIDKNELITTIKQQLSIFGKSSSKTENN